MLTARTHLVLRALAVAVIAAAAVLPNARAERVRAHAERDKPKVAQAASNVDAGRAHAMPPGGVARR
jgi:hypothetical protein